MEPQASSRQSTFVDSDEADEIIKGEEERALLEAENGLRQFDEILRLAEQALANKKFDLTPELCAILIASPFKAYGGQPAR